MKRHFFIIHHNPNHVGNIEVTGSAMHALSQGANVLAPDVVFRKNKLWVLHHNNPLERHAGKPLLSEYLAELAGALEKNITLKPSLIIFDLKNTDDEKFHFEDMQKTISENFSNRIPGINMAFTTPDDFNFLLQHVGPYLLPDQAIGTDEFNKPDEAHQRFKTSGFPYIYAHGNSTIFNDLYTPISQAVALRDKGNSFKLVYPWVVDSKRNMRRYLDLGVDGIMTNKPERLKTLIDEEYSEKYEVSSEKISFRF